MDATLLSIFEKDPGVFSYFKKQYPSLVRHLKKKVFLHGILGYNKVVKGCSIIPMAILRQWLTVTNQFVCNNLDLDFRQASNIGKLVWADNCVGRLEKLKEIASFSPIHLNRIVKENFLDVILDIHMKNVVAQLKLLHPSLR
jgi:hypothetical protein